MVNVVVDRGLTAVKISALPLLSTNLYHLMLFFFMVVVVVVVVVVIRGE